MKKIFIGLLAVIGYMSLTLSMNRPQTPQGIRQRLGTPTTPVQLQPELRNARTPPTPPRYSPLYTQIPRIRQKRKPNIETINLFKSINDGTFNDKSEEEKNNKFKELIIIAQNFNIPESTQNSQIVAQALNKIFPEKITQGILKNAYALNTPKMNPDLAKVANKIITHLKESLTECPVCLDKFTANDKKGIVRLSCCAKAVHATCMNNYFQRCKNKTKFACSVCREYLFNPQDKGPVPSRIRKKIETGQCAYCTEPCLNQIKPINSNQQMHEKCIKHLLRKYQTLELNNAQTPEQVIDSEDDDDEFEFLQGSPPPFIIQNNN